MGGRYTVTKELCGEPTPMYVARFCGEWISPHVAKASASLACAYHYRQKVLRGKPLVNTPHRTYPTLEDKE